MPSKVRVADLVQDLDLEVICAEEALQREITVADLSRPGLVMAGFYTYYPPERVQVLGKTELSFFQTLSSQDRIKRAEVLCDEKTPCICIARNLEVPMELAMMAEEKQIPLLRSSVPTTIMVSRITSFLENKLAPSTTIHGVLVDVYGVGMLITGTSGIGKSETALELVKRGHRLIADDAVEIRQTADNILYGNAPKLIKHLLEIRGVGIINVMTLFGAGAVRNVKKITIVVKLETWQQDRQYDRLGLEEDKTKIIDTELPIVTIPVRPGRNLAVILEVAAMNYRLKRMGYNAAMQFTTQLTDTIQDDLEDID